MCGTLRELMIVMKLMKKFWITNLNFKKVKDMSKWCEDCSKNEYCGVKYDAETEGMVVTFCVYKENQHTDF